MKYWLKSMVLILMMVFLTACGKNVGQQIEEQLQLGQKYLMEMKYDEAIAAFEKVISLEPKEFRGYEGLMTAYVETERKEDAERVVSDGLAVADTIGEWGEDLRAAFLYFVDYAVTYFQGEGQDDVVVALLERRLQLEESDETYRLLIGLYGKTEQLEKLYQLLGEYDGENEEILKDKEDLAFAETFVQELTDLCAAADIDSLVSIMGGEDYARLVDLISRLENPTFFVTGNTGLGIYSKRLYYGDYEGNTRSGNGLWVYMPDSSYYYSKGMWKDDKPNGYQEFVAHTWYNEGRLDSGAYSVYRGNVADGLWDGAVELSEVFDGNVEHHYVLTFDKGNWEVLYTDTESERDPYVVGVDDYVILAVDQDALQRLQGLPGFGSTEF